MTIYDPAKLHVQLDDELLLGRSSKIICATINYIMFIDLDGPEGNRLHDESTCGLRSLHGGPLEKSECLWTDLYVFETTS